MPGRGGRGSRPGGIRRSIVAWFTRLDPPPDVFAVVMATGILSIAAADHGYRVLDAGLSLVAATAFVVLGSGSSSARPRIRPGSCA